MAAGGSQEGNAGRVTRPRTALVRERKPGDTQNPQEIADYALVSRILSQGIAIDKISIAIERLSIAIPKGSIAIERFSIGIPKGSIAIERLSIGIPKGSIAIERFSIGIPKGSIAIEETSIGNANC